MYQKNNTKEADGLNKHQRKWSDYWGSEKSDAYRSEKQMVLKQEVQSNPDTCVCVCVRTRMHACVCLWTQQGSGNHEQMSSWSAGSHMALHTTPGSFLHLFFSAIDPHAAERLALSESRTLSETFLSPRRFPDINIIYIIQLWIQFEPCSVFKLNSLRRCTFLLYKLIVFVHKKSF